MVSLTSVEKFSRDSAMMSNAHICCDHVQAIYSEPADETEMSAHTLPDGAPHVPSPDDEMAIGVVIGIAIACALALCLAFAFLVAISRARRKRSRRRRMAQARARLL
jgi:hypothetical protein